jgi:hypothetical protein
MPAARNTERTAASGKGLPSSTPRAFIARGLGDRAGENAGVNHGNRPARPGAHRARERSRERSHRTRHSRHEQGYTATRRPRSAGSNGEFGPSIFSGSKSRRPDTAVADGSRPSTRTLTTSQPGRSAPIWNRLVVLDSPALLVEPRRLRSARESLVRQVGEQCVHGRRPGGRHAQMGLGTRTENKARPELGRLGVLGSSRASPARCMVVGLDGDQGS